MDRDEPAPAAPGPRRIARILLGVAVSAGLLAAVLSQLDLSAARAQLSRADPRWLLAALGVSALVLGARTLRFAALVDRAGPGQVARAIAIHNLLVRVTPLRLGELSLPYALKGAGEPVASSLVALFLVRLAELWLLLVLVATAAFAWLGAGRQWHWLIVAVALASAALLRARALLLVCLRAARGLARLTRLNRLASVHRGIGQLEVAAERTRQWSRRRWLALGAGTVAVTGLQLALYGCVLALCGVSAHPLQVVVGSSAAMLLGSLPMLTVGNIGTHETGWTAGFVWVGLSVDAAVVTGVVGQVVTLALAAAFAAAAWAAGARAGSVRTGSR